MKKVEIEIPEGKKVEWVNGVLTLVDDTPKDIKERIKTFEDAVMIIGNGNQAVIDYFAISETDCSNDILAFAKLRVIAEALNEEWKPKFDDDERRYYPWFYIDTENEYGEFDEEKKSRHIPLRLNNFAVMYGGLVYAFVSGTGSSSNALGSVRLAFKTKKLAEYCGNQFIDIWADLLFA